MERAANPRNVTFVLGSGFPPARGALQNPCPVGTAPGLLTPYFNVPIRPENWPKKRGPVGAPL